jgi:hypothetical protein
MPVYYFHLRDGHELLLDREGQRLGSADLIAPIALREARALISHEVRSGSVLLDRDIDVVDESGTLIHRLPFTEAVEIVAPPR